MNEVPFRTVDGATKIPLIELKNISKTFVTGDSDVRVDALRGLSLSVGAQERVVVTGPSGSGKSTLVKLVIGQGIQVGDHHGPPWLCMTASNIPFSDLVTVCW